MDIAWKVEQIHNWRQARSLIWMFRPKRSHAIESLMSCHYHAMYTNARWEFNQMFDSGEPGPRNINIDDAILSYFSRFGLKMAIWLCTTRWFFRSPNFDLTIYLKNTFPIALYWTKINFQNWFCLMHIS